MAALSVLNPTLLDLAKAQDPNGSIAAVAEILNETNEILDDMTWMEGNLITGNRSTTRTGMPDPTWRQMYGFVQPSKGTTSQVTDNCGMLEAYSEVDHALANLNNNSAQWRLLEDRIHIESMNQEIVDTLFYGNEGTEPEAFTGLSPRYNSLSAANAENIIAGGSVDTDNGSIWLICWSPMTIHGIVPKGSQAGLQIEDLGRDTATDGSGGLMQVLRSHYRWDAGLTVRDWRYAVRICNIDKSLLVKDAASGADLPDLMFRAMNLIPNLAMGRPAFYMSRDMKTMLGRQTANLTKASTLMTDMVGGKLVTRFHGIPVRRADALASNEALVS